MCFIEQKRRTRCRSVAASAGNACPKTNDLARAVGYIPPSRERDSRTGGHIARWRFWRHVIRSGVLAAGYNGMALDRRMVSVRRAARAARIAS
jgi:hypothetical protein